MTVPNDVALYELAIKAGVPMDNKIFRRIYGLIVLGCSPDVIYSLLKYLTSVHSPDSAEPVGHDSVSNIGSTTSRSVGQRHHIDRSKFTDNVLQPSRNLESQQSFHSTLSDCDQYFTEQNYEACKMLANKLKTTHNVHQK
ncbi:hypothetical protein EWB00_008365 [Schistosoma japonicum]|nr:SJCHGC05942 protein [Schistosoma japonicum]KAH8852206.1 hypothetical protein KSF78_0001072 [Schistosoma japonicum]KAH8852207.1 hypothetical protein KSF78_0001072 [Schistosoma japonicum]TNN06481.1 hypothetical protein EWB00_008365 [Schistosoma japonicum]TNN06482.1 hypothetical protein EWB00_008365 [Schistosoma japonicum]